MIFRIFFQRKITHYAGVGEGPRLDTTEAPLDGGLESTLLAMEALEVGLESPYFLAMYLEDILNTSV